MKRTWFAVAALVIALIAAVALSIPLRRFYAQQTAQHVKADFESAIAVEVEKLGGKVTFDFGVGVNSVGSREIVAIDLENRAVNDKILRQLARVTTIQRLNLDGTNIEPAAAAHVGSLPQLRSLSLARTKMGDSGVASFANLHQLRTLNLRGTPLTDEGLNQLAALSGLTNLDLRETRITSAGLKSLIRLPTLQSLSLDESCITEVSIVDLQAIRSLHRIDVRVTSGLGKSFRQKIPDGMGIVVASDLLDRELWGSGSPWDTTLAGIVEVVTAEVGLNPKDGERLINALHDAPFSFRVTQTNVVQRPEENGPEVRSIDEFILALHGRTYPAKSVRLFARDKFSKSDVPKLLEALRALNRLSDEQYLQRYGARLLARHALDDPEAVKMLDNMLRDGDPMVRASTVGAFGEQSLIIGEVHWIPSQQLAAFAMPRLVALCDDENVTVRLSVSETLGGLAFHHPHYARKAMQQLVKMISAGDWGYIVNSISRIAQVNDEAVLSFVPELRRMVHEEMIEPSKLQPTKTPLPARKMTGEVALQALFGIAHSIPDVAKDVASDYLTWIEKGQSTMPPWTLTNFVSTKNREAVEILVHGLLDLCEADDVRIGTSAQRSLASIVTAIRDLETADQHESTPIGRKN